MPTVADSLFMKLDDAICLDHMRANGFMVRFTEWHQGFQVVGVMRSDIRTIYVTDWYPTLRDAIAECYEQVKADGHLKLDAGAIISARHPHSSPD